MRQGNAGQGTFILSRMPLIICGKTVENCLSFFAWTFNLLLPFVESHHLDPAPDA